MCRDQAEGDRVHGDPQTCGFYAKVWHLGLQPVQGILMQRPPVDITLADPGLGVVAPCQEQGAIQRTQHGLIDEHLPSHASCRGSGPNTVQSSPPMVNAWCDDAKYVLETVLRHTSTEPLLTIWEAESPMPITTRPVPMLAKRGYAPLLARFGKAMIPLQLEC
eukprot:CAMPEP_0117475026 /NCGR_PEP_ID=MMETSP0784-20121206/9584_1 /TAXON_ID=39447 /ORGANISM="" /LENGTH=162 /DNA_ID=CAMNT_0005269263 /DNA_START=154 /DNA_END=640 /DNA_ORIENTATION=-